MDRPLNIDDFVRVTEAFVEHRFVVGILHIPVTVSPFTNDGGTKLWRLPEVSHVECEVDGSDVIDAAPRVIDFLLDGSEGREIRGEQRKVSGADVGSRAEHSRDKKGVERV